MSGCRPWRDTRKRKSGLKSTAFWMKIYAKEPL